MRVLILQAGFNEIGVILNLKKEGYYVIAIGNQPGLIGQKYVTTEITGGGGGGSSSYFGSGGSGGTPNGKNGGSNSYGESAGGGSPNGGSSPGSLKGGDGYITLTIQL